VLPCLGSANDSGRLTEIVYVLQRIRQDGVQLYILGVTEGASIGSSTGRDKDGINRELKDKPMYVPEGLTSVAMEFVVRKSMGEDLALFPADNDLPAVSFVVAVLSKQFPCGKPH